MSADAPEDEGFLSRWSRRKRAVAEPEALPEPCAAGLPEDATMPAATADVAEPPSLDLIDKDFDLAPWLKQNVPETWKLAALRRAWESDPAIAGFENPARDYALDWNTPGGAPGYGPLTESDDVAAMVRGIFGEAPEPEAPVIAADEATGGVMPHQLSSNDEGVKLDAAAQEDGSSHAELAAVRLSGDAASAGDTGSAAPEIAPPVYAAVQNSPEPKDVSVRIRKRGGGAIPI
ncbi:DUF3306 domain-containing protein [Bosea sp. 124]|uniref:DUF3306 domain-containing protein n=1 Tax=Bosea sp. 124 TaxID=2135642 RepID=UPI000D3CABB6|nr:DUF3306 domain-containing protein [Bosea sp. 124]PTM39103.1 uncharacterized protein DUF3306 [Bosea sp. 124]